MSHIVLENQMRTIIEHLPKGKEFYLHDIIENPPAQLGRRLYEDVQNGVIPDVVRIDPVNGIERYKKI